MGKCDKRKLKMNKMTETKKDEKIKERKTDRRVIRTKKAIYEALTELMTKKPLEQITVTDIARKADINRKTFYTYYSAPDDVINETINNSLKAFAADMEHFDFSRSEKDPQYAEDFMKEHRPESPFREGGRLLESNLDRVSEKMCQIVKNKARENLKRRFPDLNSDKIEYVTEFMFSGYYSIITLYREKHHDDITKGELRNPDTEFIQLKRQLMKACGALLKEEKED